MEVASSSQGDGENHCALHPAHLDLHPDGGSLHQPLHLPPHHPAYGCCRQVWYYHLSMLSLVQTYSKSVVVVFKPYTHKKHTSRMF